MLPSQVSFSNLDSNVVLVTGNGTYRFYRMQDNNYMKVVH